MGGSIFNSQGVKARAIDSYEFNNIKFAISTYCLGGAFKNHHAVRSFKDKDIHNDIDFLVSSPFKLGDWKDCILNNPYIKQRITHVAYNNDEFSILFDGVQCDFRIVNSNYWNSSVFYADFDPSNNAFGRIVRFFGCRLSYKGLVYPIYTENGCNKLGEIILTSEPEEISEFLGVDHDKKTEGFNTLQEIFDYIISSKYYSIECFDSKNWDSATRTRNRKRKRFCEFVEFVEKDCNYSKYEFLPRERKYEYADWLDKEFPNSELKKNIKEARKNYEVNKELSKKFDGHKAMELSGLSGKSLGDILGKYKNSKDGWVQFLKDYSQEEIEKDFIEFCKSK